MTDHEIILRYKQTRDKELVDELEGLSLLKNPDRLPEIVRELEHRMAARQIRILSLKPGLFLAAAAMIILLVGAVFIFHSIVPPQQKPLFSEQHTTSGIPDEVAAPSIVEEDAPSVEMKEQPIPATEKQKKSETSSVKIANDLKIEALPDSKTGEPLPTTAMEKAEPRVSDVSGMGAEVNRLSTRQKGSQVGGVDSKMMGINLMVMAMQQFDKQNFPEASRLFQEVIQQDTGNYKAIYYLASCYIKMEKPKKALRILERLMEDPDSTYYNQAIDMTQKLKANEPL